MNSMITLLFLALSTCSDAAPTTAFQKRRGGGGGGGGGHGGGGGGSRGAGRAGAASGSSSGGGGGGGSSLSTWKIVVIVISVFIFIGILWFVLPRYVLNRTEWWQNRLEKKREKDEERANLQRIESEDQARGKKEIMGGHFAHSV